MTPIRPTRTTFAALAIWFLSAASFAALAQDSSAPDPDDPPVAEGEGDGDGAPPAEGEATGEGEAAKAPAAVLSGHASGTADGVPFSGAVDCSAFTAAEMVRVQSDPGAAQGEDLSGDGFFLDVTASRNRGSIALNLSVNNTSYNFTGRLAQVKDQVLSYAVTLKSASGPDISITLKVDCTA